MIDDLSEKNSTTNTSPLIRKNEHLTKNVRSESFNKT